MIDPIVSLVGAMMRAILAVSVAGAPVSDIVATVWYDPATESRPPVIRVDILDDRHDGPSLSTIVRALVRAGYPATGPGASSSRTVTVYA